LFVEMTWKFVERRIFLQKADFSMADIENFSLPVQWTQYLHGEHYARKEMQKLSEQNARWPLWTVWFWVGSFIRRI
jgi:hypothetical protein